MNNSQKLELLFLQRSKSIKYKVSCKWSKVEIPSELYYILSVPTSFVIKLSHNNTFPFTGFSQEQL